MHRGAEPSLLQSLALQLADKVCQKQERRPHILLFVQKQWLTHEPLDTGLFTFYLFTYRYLLFFATKVFL